MSNVTETGRSPLSDTVSPRDRVVSKLTLGFFGSNSSEAEVHRLYLDGIKMIMNLPYTPETDEVALKWWREAWSKEKQLTGEPFKQA